MLDINGQPLAPGDPVQLLCEVVSVDPQEGVRVRILNSEMELVVGCKHDEALGGWVADSELAKFVEITPRPLSIHSAMPAIVPGPPPVDSAMPDPAHGEERGVQVQASGEAELTTAASCA